MARRRRAGLRDRVDHRPPRRHLRLRLRPVATGQVPVRMKMGADGMPQLPPGMGKNGLMMMMMNGRLRLVGNGQPVSALTEMLGNQLGRPVVDATELKAKYDFTLDFTPENMSGPMGMMPPPPPHDGGPGGGGADGECSGSGPLDLYGVAGADGIEAGAAQGTDRTAGNRSYGKSADREFDGGQPSGLVAETVRRHKASSVYLISRIRRE